MTVRFIDTNILLRYLSGDDPVRAQRALTLLRRIELGEEQAVTSQLVIFETIFSMQRRYRVPKAQIRDRIQAILNLRNLQIPDKHLFHQALDLFVERDIPFADAFNATYMQTRGVTEIYTWDRDYDRIPDIQRVEPEDGEL